MRTSDMGNQKLIDPLGHPTLSPLITTFNQMASEYGVDPCLIAAIAFNESSWNKFALSFDGNFGRGLMQIDAGFHAFAETNIVYEVPERIVDAGDRPGKAVDVAASVKNNAPVFQAHESLGYALSMLIVPALRHFYSRADQIECAVGSYNAGIGGVDAALARGEGPESATYGAQYVPNVLATRKFLADTSAANAKNSD